MINKVHELTFSPPEADDFEVEITIRSRKYDCHTAYRANKLEIENNHIEYIIRTMIHRLQDFIVDKNEGENNGGN